MIALAEATSSAAQQRVWFGLLRVVHLAALLLFSAKRKGISFLLTRTTEVPLDSGKYATLITTFIQYRTVRQVMV